MTEGRKDVLGKYSRHGKSNMQYGTYKGGERGRRKVPGMSSERWEAPIGPHRS